MRKIQLSLALLTLSISSSHAAIVANLFDSFAAEELTASDGDAFGSVDGWTLTGTAGLIYSVGDLGNNNVSGYADPTATGFGSSLPALSQSDIFDGGTVPADHLAFHAVSGTNLVITWTADQNYTNLFVDYDFDKVGNNGNPNSGGATLTIGGTAGVNVATLTNSDDANSNTVANVSAGQTVTFTFTGNSGGEAAGNFIIDATVVPEPSSALFLGLGSLLCLARRRR